MLGSPLQPRNRDHLSRPRSRSQGRARDREQAVWYPLEDLIREETDVPGVCFSGIQSSTAGFMIIGELFIKNNYIVFDQEKRRVGIAPLKEGPRPEPPTFIEIQGLKGDGDEDDDEEGAGEEDEEDEDEQIQAAEALGVEDEYQDQPEDVDAFLQGQDQGQDDDHNWSASLEEEVEAEGVEDEDSEVVEDIEETEEAEEEAEEEDEDSMA